MNTTQTRDNHMTELALFGTDLFGEVVRPKASGPVAERFTLPPFTILDARAGEWQERKRAWAAMGIEGEVGRAGVHQYGMKEMVIVRQGRGFNGQGGKAARMASRRQQACLTL